MTLRQIQSRPRLHHRRTPPLHLHIPMNNLHLLYKRIILREKRGFLDARWLSDIVENGRNFGGSEVG
jgi:hypothetical protein